MRSRYRCHLPRSHADAREVRLPGGIVSFAIFRAFLGAAGDHSHEHAPYGEPVHSFFRSRRVRHTAGGGLKSIISYVLEHYPSPAGLHAPNLGDGRCGCIPGFLVHPESIIPGNPAL
ncbi:protein of unknown function [Methanoculleus bourgensis]|uniref:Uncharacterized protein n=1 Tax=Methanoculleus bourgensis TaxID=83986 RepID=A0A0X3BPV6_9EURY|nr:protein of unknown function [Methanoculleus bourgensis]